jgi:hypothetical protein
MESRTRERRATLLSFLPFKTDTQTGTMVAAAAPDARGKTAKAKPADKKREAAVKPGASTSPRAPMSASPETHKEKERVRKKEKEKKEKRISGGEPNNNKAKNERERRTKTKTKLSTKAKRRRSCAVDAPMRPGESAQLVGVEEFLRTSVSAAAIE